LGVLVKEPRPFSGAKFHKNRERMKVDETECALCGKPCKKPWPFSVQVVEGGGRFATEREYNDLDPVDGAGDMGCWPVGSDCARTLRAAGVFVKKESGR
jgi:hypothetical protein